MTLHRAHEQLRGALNYRIQRHTMSVKLLSAVTGIGQPHLCNFLHGRRSLSLESMDKVLHALGLTVELLPVRKAL
jgi:transcriptional regulator with XRE-family HTH domain